MSCLLMQSRVVRQGYGTNVCIYQAHQHLGHGTHDSFAGLHGACRGLEHIASLSSARAHRKLCVLRRGEQMFRWWQRRPVTGEQHAVKVHAKSKLVEVVAHKGTPPHATAPRQPVARGPVHQRACDRVHIRVTIHLVMREHISHRNQQPACNGDDRFRLPHPLR